MVLGRIKGIKKLGEMTGILPSEYKSDIVKELKKLGYEKTEHFCRNENLEEDPCEFTRYRGKEGSLLGKVVIVGNNATLSSNPNPYSLRPRSWLDVCPAKNGSFACSDLKTLENLPKRRRRFHYTLNGEMLDYLKEITK